jgi:3-oxoacyl-[acyl-carrier-protein] synthase III
MSRHSLVTGIGSYLPPRVLTNDQLAQDMDTSDTWIRTRTGIEERHIAVENETTATMAAKAAAFALATVSIAGNEVLGVVVATSTPDNTMPSVATMVQAQLGLSAGPALDVEAACAGFVYALSVAHGWLMSGIADHVLVIGAETMSRIVDWSDRGTCILFGDGAGAIVVSAVNEENAEGRGLKSFALNAQGEYGALLTTNGGISSTKNAGLLTMQGQEVFRHGVEKMSDITLAALARSPYALSDVNWVIPHQANKRMIEAIAKRLDVPLARMVISVPQHANTSAASIPLALSVAVSDGRIKKGDILALPALGAGLVWGCAILVW